MIIRSFLDDESSIKESMDQLLGEMRKLNVTFSSDIEGKLFITPVDSPDWNLLETIMGLVQVQSDNLASLKPTISYIVNNNRLNKSIFIYFSVVSSIVRMTRVTWSPLTRVSAFRSRSRPI